MEFIVIYVSRHAMEPSPDLLMAGMAQDLSQSVINAAAPAPVVLTRINTTGAGGLLRILKDTAFHHSGVTEISPKPDNSAPGVKSLVWHTFYSGSNIMGCLSLWENRRRESKGWIWDSEYGQMTLMARYWGVISDNQDYVRLQEESRLVRASAKRWEADCIAETCRASRLAVECQEAHSQLVTQQASLDQLRANIRDYVSSSATMQEDYNSTLAELVTVKASLSEVENELYQANREIERLRRVVSSDSTALQNAKDEILVLKRALAEYAHTTQLERRPSQPKNEPVAVGSLASQILAFDRAALKHVE